MKQTKKHKQRMAYVIIGLLSFFYLTPLLMTTLYAFGEEWGKSILPTRLTTQWFSELFQDTTFIQAIGRSLLLSASVLFVVLLIMIPSVIVVYLYFPRLDKALQSMSLIPYAIPAVVLVTALLKTYAKSGIPMVFVLGGALFITVIPIVYMGIRNSLQAINTKQLIEAGSMLGASPLMIMVKVILPNLRIGIVLSSVMVFSGLFGEYVLTNLLIGGRFETLRIYMLRRMNENGHLASAVMVCYFILIFAMGMVINYLFKQQKMNGMTRRTMAKERQAIQREMTRVNVVKENIS